MAKPHLLLMGLRGSGKSTLGADLARRTKRTFVDLDQITPGLLGRTSPAEALEQDGQQAFRQAETQALRAALKKGASVIALGGGTPTAPGAAETIREASSRNDAIAIYLRASAATLRHRLAETDVAQRPSLTGSGTLEEIDTLLEERDALYRSIADAIITTDDLTPSEVVELLLAVHDQH